MIDRVLIVESRSASGTLLIFAMEYGPRASAAGVEASAGSGGASSQFANPHWKSEAVALQKRLDRSLEAAQASHRERHTHPHPSARHPPWFKLMLRADSAGAPSSLRLILTMPPLPFPQQPSASAPMPRTWMDDLNDLLRIASKHGQPLLPPVDDDPSAKPRHCTARQIDPCTWKLPLRSHIGEKERDWDALLRDFFPDAIAIDAPPAAAIAVHSHYFLH